MVQLGCALDTILLCLSAVISLELMAKFRGPWGHKMILCPLDVQIFLIVASIFYITAVYGPIGLWFEYDAVVGIC